MSMIASPPPSPDVAAAGPRRKRWTGVEFDRYVDQGMFVGERLELIHGELITMAPMKDRHADSVTKIMYALIAMYPVERFTVRIQCPMRLGESRPEPDVAVLAGPPSSHPTHPETAVVIVEVAESSLDYDRLTKGPLYAGAGVAMYVIVNLDERCVEVYTDPTTPASGPAPGNARYATARTCRPGETFAVPQADGEVAVDDLLGPANTSGQ